jgi:hypothetical protein
MSEEMLVVADDPAELARFTTYTRTNLAEIRQTLLDVHAEVYAAEIAVDPFFSVESYDRRLGGHAAKDSWMCVVGEVGGEVVGYAYGRLDSVEE